MIRRILIMVLWQLWFTLPIAFAWPNPGTQEWLYFAVTGLGGEAFFSLMWLIDSKPAETHPC